VTLDPNYTGPYRNFGTLGVVADPVRPSDLYAFICLQGVWKSTDFGLTWKKVNTGTKGAVLDTGLPWAAAIDPDSARDASTPPTLYTMNGYGSELGVFKSTDGGVNWTKYFENEDAYSFDIDPYDHRHLISGMHESAGMAESTDGGVTWRKIPGTISGTSIYAFFIDTGVPETTRNTWLLVPQIYSGTASITTNGGSSFQLTAGDAPNASEGFAHPHGGNQVFRAGPGVAYIGAAGGVWSTKDSGATWRKAFSGDNYGYASGVIGTPTTLYSWATGANQSGIEQAHHYKAPRSAGAPWTAIASPSGMNNGPHAAAVTFDGAHHIIVGGAVNAGIWRYVEE
jgi:hypothetical protein